VPLDIVSWWAGEDNSLDIAGGVHGFPVGSPKSAADFTGGVVGRAFAFTGTNRYYIVFDDSNKHNLPGDLTIETWINVPGDSSGSRTILEKSDSGGQNVSYSLSISPGGRLSFSSTTAGSKTEVNTVAVVPLDQNVHVAVTLLAGDLRMFIDGQETAHIFFGTSRPSTANGVLIGAGRSSTVAVNFFKGKIDELSLYKRALTNAEIAGIHAAGASGKARYDAALNFEAWQPDDTTQEGIWRYGQVLPETQAGGVPPVTTFSELTTGVTAGGFGIWNGTSPLRFTANLSGDVLAETENGATVTYLPGALTLRPGESGRYAALKWTAPATGNYAFSALFAAADTTPTDVFCRVLFQGAAGVFTLVPKSQLQGSNTVTHWAKIPLEAGEKIYFLVGDGANTNPNLDSTSVFATLVPLEISNSGSRPTAVTGPASPIDSTTATLNGTVNPNGAETTYHFEYRTNPGALLSTPTMTLPSGSTAVPVSANLTGLNPNTEYFFFLVASNDFGSHTGAVQSFTTGTGTGGGNAPGATTSAPTRISHTGATLNGAILRKGESVSYYFEYGPTTAYGQQTPTSTSPPGTEPYAISAELTGLTATTAYHYRLVATSSSSGTGTSPDASFTTRGEPGDFSVVITDLRNRDVVSPESKLRAAAEVKIPRGSRTRIASVQFLLNGQPVGFPDVKPSYRFDGTISEPGIHIFSALATDTKGRQIESEPVIFTIAEVGAGPLALTSSLSPSDAIPGDLLTYTLFARNSSSGGVKNVELALQVPLGAGYVETRFVDANGQPVAAPKGSDVFFNGANGVVTVQIKEIEPFAAVTVQLLARVPYDQTTTGNVIANSAFNIAVAQGKQKFTGAFPTRSVTVAGALPAGAPRPRLGLFVKQLGAGELPQDKSVVTVTTAGLGVPDVKPKRLSNEITYQVSFVNYGNAPAHSVRVVAPVPPGTSYKKKSAGVITAVGDVIPVLEPAEAFGLLFFDVPRLEANFPSVAGSGKTLEYTVRVDKTAEIGTRIAHLGAAVSSGELLTPVNTLTQKVAQVVAPSQMTYDFTAQYGSAAGAAPDSGTGTISHTIFFHNQGGLAAREVGIRYTVPPGLTFQSASFADHLGKPLSLPLPRGRDIPQKPLVGATAGDVVFEMGTIKPGAFGFAQVVLKFDPATRPEDKLSQAPFIGYDSSTTGPQAVRAPRDPAVKLLGQPNFAGLIRQAHLDPTLSRLFILQAGPAAATEGSEFDLLLAWGNLSDNAPGEGTFFFPIPVGTEIVSASDAQQSFGGPSNSASINPPGTDGAPNGQVVWTGGGPRPHSIFAATVRLRVKLGVTGEIKVSGSRTTFDRSVPRYGAPITVRLVSPGVPVEAFQSEIYNAAMGEGSAASVGTARTPAEKFLEGVKQIAEDSRVVSIAGADYAHLAGNDGVAIPLGGGRMVAAGGLNLVQQSSASMVAAGGLNLVAAGGGNMKIEVPGSGLVTSAQLISNAPSLVAAGGMNMVAAGGLNLLRKTSSLISNDGSTLIGLDGSTLVGLDGGTLGTFSQRVGFAASFSPGAGASLILTANAASMVAAGGGNLRIAGGGHLVAAGGGNIIPPAGLVGNDGASVIARDGASLISNDGSTLISNDGSTLISNDGSTMVAAGGGNFVTGSAGLAPR